MYIQYSSIVCRSGVGRSTILISKAVGSSPGVGRLLEQSDEAAKGSEIEGRSADRSAEKKFAYIFSYQDRLSWHFRYITITQEYKGRRELTQSSNAAARR